MSTTITRTTARIAATIDLSETAMTRTLDDLLNDDRVLVDVWDTDDQDGSAVIAMLGDEAVVEFERDDAFDAMAMIEHRLRRGWGMEGPVPAGVAVTPFRPDFEHGTAGLFVQARRADFVTWRLIESTQA